MLCKHKKLTKPQRTLLNKGLTFIPTFRTGEWIREEAIQELKTYHRKVKLAVFFEDQEEGTPQKFVNPSNWTPPWDKLPPEVETLINQDLTYMKKNFKIIQERHNMTKEEYDALKQLKQDKEIIIKPADKGSMVVVMDRTQYVREVERQLTDTHYYKKLKNPIYLDTTPMVKEIIRKIEGKHLITRKQAEYLLGSTTPRERRFYILPKIHKDIQKWTIPYEIPPGRPIVSDCNSETYHTAEYIEFFLNPLSKKHSSYIKDTYHFIQIIQSLNIPHSKFLFFTMDVSNLYTNIDIDKGIEVIKKFLKRYPDKNRPDEELIQLLDINLRRNDFVFNDQYYLQIKGTAMGKRFAPSYANIFMADWEEEVLKKCPLKPLCFLRYLDDIFGIWTHPKEALYRFVAILNGQDPSIQLTLEIGEMNINFLDTTVFKGPNFNENRRLDIKVHFKKTDKHCLLHKNSFHPKHTHRGLIKSQLTRFKRICTQDEDFFEATRILFSALRNRGYNRGFLKQCFKSFQLRHNKPHEQEETKIIPYIMKYSTATNLASLQIKEHFKQYITNKGILKTHRVIRAFKRHQNLKDILTKAKLTTTTRLGEKNNIPQLIHKQQIQNTKNNTIYPIYQNFALTSTNCIYAIICETCKKKYIGNTKTSLGSLLEEFNKKVLQGKEEEDNVIIHFRSHSWEESKIMGLQRDNNWTDHLRRERTKQWIEYLNSRRPDGLN